VTKRRDPAAPTPGRHSTSTFDQAARAPILIGPLSEGSRKSFAVGGSAWRRRFRVEVERSRAGVRFDLLRVAAGVREGMHALYLGAWVLRWGKRWVIGA